MTQGPRSRREGGRRLSFQTRLTVTIVAASIIPLGIFGVLLLTSGAVDPAIGTRFLLFIFAISVIVGVIGGAAVGATSTRRCARSTAVSRVSAGDMSQPIPVTDNDVLAHLAESHNRLASDATRRNQQLALILAAVESAEPRDGIDAMATRAAHDAEAAFGFISAEVRFVDPDRWRPRSASPASPSRSGPSCAPATTGWA